MGHVHIHDENMLLNYHYRTKTSNHVVMGVNWSTKDAAQLQKNDVTCTRRTSMRMRGVKARLLYPLWQKARAYIHDQNMQGRRNAISIEGARANILSRGPRKNSSSATENIAVTQSSI